MSWANSVLPVIMVASGQKPERLPESAIAVQNDTTLHRSEIRISHGFQRFDFLISGFRGQLHCAGTPSTR